MSAPLLEVLRLYGADPDVETVASAFGCSPQTIRRDVRDLREAGAFGELKPRDINDDEQPSEVIQ